MTRTLARLALLVLAVTVSISAFAGTKSENLTLTHDAQLNGTTIPAGEYKVKYDANGSTCLVKVMKGSKTVATANGELKQLDKKPANDQIKLENENGGVPVLSEMDFHDSTTAITFSSGTTTASGE
jgi:hypothetical protein